MNTDVIILCGGEGTRLRAVVGESQKVMATVGEEPFLDFLIKYIRAQGSKRIILATGFKAQDVEAYYDGKFKDLEILFSREDEPLGTGGAIKKACGLVHSDSFFVLNGDSFCPVDFKKCLEFHARYKATATVVVAKVTDKKDYGSIVFDGDNRIVSFQEKTASQTATYVNAGVYCLVRGIKNQMPIRAKFSMEKDFFPSLENKAFYGFIVDEPFIDIGTPERYQWVLRNKDQLLKPR